MKLKRYRTWLVMFTLLLVFLLVLPGLLHAQDPSEIDPAVDPDAPIDGGLGLLIAAGIGYGIKQIRYSKKKHISEPEN